MRKMKIREKRKKKKEIKPFVNISKPLSQINSLNTSSKSSFKIVVEDILA